MSYRYLFRLHFLVRFKNRPITRTAIFFNLHFILKTFDLRSVTSGDQLQNYHSVKINFIGENPLKNQTQVNSKKKLQKVGFLVAI
jgi:hypothetical protein